MGHCSKFLTKSTGSLIPYISPWGRYYYHPHLTDEETEDQREEVTRSRSQKSLLMKPNFKPVSVECKTVPEQKVYYSSGAHDGDWDKLLKTNQLLQLDSRWCFQERSSKNGLLIPAYDTGDGDVRRWLFPQNPGQVPGGEGGSCHVLRTCLSPFGLLYPHHHRLCGLKYRFFTVLEVESLKLRHWHIQYLLKDHFWVHGCSLLAMSSHGRRQERILWGLFYRGTNPIHEGSAFMP